MAKMETSLNVSAANASTFSETKSDSVVEQNSGSLQQGHAAVSGSAAVAFRRSVKIFIHAERSMFSQIAQAIQEGKRKFLRVRVIDPPTALSKSNE